MQKTSFVLFSVLGFLIGIIIVGLFPVQITPMTANALVAVPQPLIVENLDLNSADTVTTSDGTSESIAPSTTTGNTPQTVPQGDAGLPVRLIIPSIGLDTAISYMGVNGKGEMDVPDGESANVGWYKNGTVPGKTGSAVIAAHVFAAFKNLDQLAVGADIYVVTKDGTKLRFVANDAKTYALKELSANLLFSRKDAKRLNLITCAGTFVKALDTYDHRLVVFATLA